MAEKTKQQTGMIKCALEAFRESTDRFIKKSNYKRANESISTSQVALYLLTESYAQGIQPEMSYLCSFTRETYRCIQQLNLISDVSKGNREFMTLKRHAKKYLRDMASRRAIVRLMQNRIDLEIIVEHASKLVANSGQKYPR